MEKELELLRWERMSCRDDDSERNMKDIHQKIESIERILEGRGSSRGKHNYSKNTIVYNRDCF